MENHLTKEEYEYLSEYSDRLDTASRSKYSRAIPSAVVHKMRMIYSRLIDKPYSMNESCGGCIMTLLRKLKPYYDEYRERTIREISEEESNSNSVGGGNVETGDTEDN